MSEKKQTTIVYQDSPDNVETYYKNGIQRFRTKRIRTNYLKGPRYENQNVKTWEKFGIDINKKGGKPPLEDFEDLDQ
jgi:hypothetical protein